MTACKTEWTTCIQDTINWTENANRSLQQDIHSAFMTQCCLHFGPKIAVIMLNSSSLARWSGGTGLDGTRTISWWLRGCLSSMSSSLLRS